MNKRLDINDGQKPLLTCIDVSPDVKTYIHNSTFWKSMNGTHVLVGRCIESPDLDLVDSLGIMRIHGTKDTLDEEIAKIGFALSVGGGVSCELLILKKLYEHIPLSRAIISPGLMILE